MISDLQRKWDSRSVMICPSCKSKGTKALYAGIPVKICTNDIGECYLVWGFFSPLLTIIPFNGWFFTYEGNYFAALWEWLWL